jgi:hypothetical protein
MTGVERPEHGTYRRNASMSKKELGVTVAGGISRTTLEPAIRITFESGESLSMTHLSALKLALNLQEAAAFAEADSFLAQYIATSVVPEGASEEEREGSIATILNEFREWRSRQEVVVD